MTSRRAEDRIMELAASQHGLVTRAQLLEVGLGRRAVDYRIKTSRLRPVHRGVYRVGPLVPANQREMAAVLVCGPEAVVSHRSAAGLWQLLSPPDPSAPVDVTVPSRIRRRRPGVRAHRGPALEPCDVARADGIPSTTPSRTILDLAGTMGSRELEHALARAERRGLVSLPELSSLIDRHPGRRGIRTLRTLLDQKAGPAFTRSEAEERFLTLIRKARLPAPPVNAAFGGYEVDFLWRAERLVVEVDGFAFHASPGQFESDRLRDAELSARGLRVTRVTWRQIDSEPEAMSVRLATALAVPGPH